MDNLLWYFKQILPLKYDTIYGLDGQWYVVIWRMWFGRCFHQKHYKLVDATEYSVMPDNSPKCVEADLEQQPIGI